MGREVVAVVTGFVRNAELMRAGFEPLIALAGQKVIDRILYVTWDRADLDGLLAPLEGQAGIAILREPEPDFPDCFPYRKGFLYQQRNLTAALARIADPEALVVKLRPDFIAEPAFLASKILAFDHLCAPSTLADRLRLPLPPSPFHRKIWVPWADGNMPFFIEDGAYIGLRRDVGLLASPAAEAVATRYGDPASAWAVHVARFAPPFLDSLPIFARFLKELSLFVQDQTYRMKMLENFVSDIYLWHLLYANAWALASSFHVDCGYPGQLHFFPSKFSKTAGRHDLDGAPVYPPYNAIEAWRSCQMPGGLTPCILHPFARLLDDSWQSALFRRPLPTDITVESRTAIINNLAAYRSGVLNRLEESFYSRLAEFHDQQQRQVA